MSKNKVNIYDSVNTDVNADTAEKSTKKSKPKKIKKDSKFKKWVKKHKVLTAIICILLVAAIVIGSVFAFKNADSSSTSYAFIRTTTISKGDLENSISATGSVESAETSSVTTSLSYTIKTVNVAVGDTVEEGDVICTLDTSELEEQIEREEESLEQSVSSAQKSYDSALESYNDAVSTLDDYEDELNDAAIEKNSAYTPYSKALSAIKPYQSAYDSALSAFNSAGVALVTAKTNYNSALSKYKAGSITKTELTSAAKSYMTAVQNYYGGCSVGTYDISDGGSSTSSSSDSAGGQASSSSGSSSISVTQTANDICDGVVSTLRSVANVTTIYSSGTNTLLKLSQKASALSTAKTQCNYSSLESAYESASSAYESAQQTYSQYSDAVSQAKEQLDQAEDQLSSASTSDTLTELTNQLEECELKAEQAGTVISLNATVGSSATGMSAVATISNLDKLKVSITIEEADINDAVTGLSCYITSDASDETLNGTLTQVDPTASESGSFGAEVTVDSETDDMRIGMNASVEILISSTEDVYQVPIDAVGNDDDGNGDYVYRQTGGEGTDMTFEKIYVTTGDQNDYYIEIESDELNEGDVIRSSADLTEGIETGETSDSDDSSSSLFGSLFSGMGGSGGGDMSSGGNMSSDSGGRGDMGSGGDMPSGGGFSGGGM